MKHRLLATSLILFALAPPVLAQATQPKPVTDLLKDRDTLLTEENTTPQEEATTQHPLAFMFGEWVGTSTGATPDGNIYTLKQTERVGPILNGQAVVIEGKGYKANGEVALNTFAIISPAGPENRWEMRNYVGTHAGTFPVVPAEDGYAWATPAGPDARIVYRAEIKDGRWQETGQLQRDGQAVRSTFSMDLQRVGDTDWPAGDPVNPDQAD